MVNGVVESFPLKSFILKYQTLGNLQEIEEYCLEKKIPDNEFDYFLEQLSSGVGKEFKVKKIICGGLIGKFNLIWKKEHLTFQSNPSKDFNFSATGAFKIFGGMYWITQF